MCFGDGVPADPGALIDAISIDRPIPALNFVTRDSEVPTFVSLGYDRVEMD
jgi:hypothetical protein